ncbi:MAG: DUF5941 domain-containing protein [Trebonia sp.]
MSHLGVRQAVFSRLSPLTLGRISVTFAVIAAVWLAAASVRAELIALAAAIAVVITGHAGRVLAGQRSTAAVEWGLVGCGTLAESAVYAGMAAAADFHAGAQRGLAGSSLNGTFVAGLGGAGAAGIWRLAIMAVILTLLTAMADICAHGPALSGIRLWLFGPPGDIRLPVACAAAAVFGARAAFLVALVLGAAALGATIVDGIRQQSGRGEPRGYRGDGRIAVWIGKWVAGKVPPLPPLAVGLLVTGVLTALGLHNLSGILLLTPVEAMLLAAFASWHPHDGRSDWLAPPLLQAAEYVFLAEIGYAGHVWPPLTFAVVTVAGLRHLDLAYRARGNLADGIDRRGFGWEGRMIIAGIAAAVGVAPVAYGALALYLWWRVSKDWMVGWSARHPAIKR